MIHDRQGESFESYQLDEASPSKYRRVSLLRFPHPRRLYARTPYAVHKIYLQQRNIQR